MDILEKLILTVPVFLLSLAVHEYMHAWAATKLGDPTPKAMGRLTLNPIAHLDPLGSLMFVIGTVLGGFLIGWAKPVPINRIFFKNPRRDFALVGISGPAANFVQAVVWYAIFRSLMILPLMDNVWLGILLDFARYGVFINIILLCFNLVPIPPLDGSRVLSWLLPALQAYSLERLEPYGFIIILMLIWTGLFGLVYHPLVSFVARSFPGI